MLLGLLVLGVALRLLTVISLRPATILEDGYQNFAVWGPFKDPQHPAGYALILGALGHVTHNMNLPVLLQHLAGICSALFIGAATRRITGSQWAGLVPAGIILLDGDVIFLEHSIMSETWELLATTAGLYAAVRTLDESRLWTPWPLVAGAMFGIAAVIRTTNVVLIVVVVFVLLVGPPRSVKRWRPRWVHVGGAAGMAAIVLLAYAGANAQVGQGFGIAPSPGWYLYGRVAQFADCNRFTPPPGTQALCQKIPVSQRPGAWTYMFFKPRSPALRLTGGFGKKDSLIGSWAQRALRAQFGDFLATGWAYFRSYYVPSSLPDRLKGDTAKLDPQLDFTYTGNLFTPAAQSALESFFGPFTIRRFQPGLQVLRAWQRVFRFGATALFVTTILTMIGLVIGSRRSRFGVVLFGVGGLSLLVAPALTGNYVGRYTVPMAGPLMAASAITLTEIIRARRRARADPPAHPPSIDSTGVQAGVTG